MIKLLIVLFLFGCKPKNSKLLATDDQPTISKEGLFQAIESEIIDPFEIHHNIDQYDSALKLKKQFSHSIQKYAAVASSSYLSDDQSKSIGSKWISNQTILKISNFLRTKTLPNQNNCLAGERSELSQAVLSALMAGVEHESTGYKRDFADTTTWADVSKTASQILSQSNQNEFDDIELRRAFYKSAYSSMLSTTFINRWHLAQSTSYDINHCKIDRDWLKTGTQVIPVFAQKELLDACTRFSQRPIPKKFSPPVIIKLLQNKLKELDQTLIEINDLLELRRINDQLELRRINDQLELRQITKNQAIILASGFDRYKMQVDNLLASEIGILLGTTVLQGYVGKINKIETTKFTEKYGFHWNYHSMRREKIHNISELRTTHKKPITRSMITEAWKELWNSNQNQLGELLEIGKEIRELNITIAKTSKSNPPAPADFYVFKNRASKTNSKKQELMKKNRYVESSRLLEINPFLFGKIVFHYPNMIGEACGALWKETNRQVASEYQKELVSGILEFLSIVPLVRGIYVGTSAASQAISAGVQASTKSIVWKQIAKSFNPIVQSSLAVSYGSVDALKANEKKRNLNRLKRMAASSKSNNPKLYAETLKSWDSYRSSLNRAFFSGAFVGLEATRVIGQLGRNVVHYAIKSKSVSSTLNIEAEKLKRIICK